MGHSISKLLGLINNKELRTGLALENYFWARMGAMKLSEILPQ
jgi:hypothetical protein